MEPATSFCRICQVPKFLPSERGCICLVLIIYIYINMRGNFFDLLHPYFGFLIPYGYHF